MRIGLPGLGSTVDGIVRQAERAEAGGFSSLWYTSAALGDPLVPIALAGRATSTIELGTAVLQTYPCHPMLQASRAAAVVSAIGAPTRFTLGVGPSHQPVIEGMLGMSYDTPGRHTDEDRVIAEVGPAIDEVPVAPALHTPRGPRAEAVLDAKRGLGREAVGRIVWARGAQIDIPDLHPHELRCTLAGTLDARNVPVQDIRLVLRHHHVGTTQTHLADNPLRVRDRMRSFTIGPSSTFARVSR